MKVLFIDYNTIGIKRIKKIDRTQFHKIFIIGRNKCHFLGMNVECIASGSQKNSTLAMISFLIGKYTNSFSDVTILTEHGEENKSFGSIKHICLNFDNDKTFNIIGKQNGI